MLARAESDYEDPFDKLGAQEDRSETHQHIGAERGLAQMTNESPHTRSQGRFPIVVGSMEPTRTNRYLWMPQLAVQCCRLLNSTL